MSVNVSSPVVCPPRFVLAPDNVTCVCAPGYYPPGLCIYDSYYASTPAFQAFELFFVVAFTSLAVISFYEMLYAVFKRDRTFNMFFVSRIVTMFSGVIGCILFADFSYWRGVPFISLPVSSEGNAALVSLSLLLHMCVQGVLAANWIVFFFRARLVNGKWKVIASLIAISCYILAVFSVYVSGIAYFQPPTAPANAALGYTLTFAATGMLVAGTGIWSLSFLIVGIVLAIKIKSSSVRLESEKNLFVKLIVGTVLGALLSLAYTILVLTTVFLYAIPPGEYLQRQTTYNWVSTLLNIFLAADLMWLVRPSHEASAPEMTTSAKSADVQSQQQNTNMTSLTLDVDD